MSQLASAAGSADQLADGEGQLRFAVEGMDCAACAQTVEKVVAGLDGVREAHVSFGSATLSVAGELPVETLQQAIAKAGYSAYLIGTARPDRAPFWRRDRKSISTTLSILTLALASALSLASAPEAVTGAAYLASMALGGWATARSALVALRARALDMHVLMTAAAIGAVAIGHYAEGAWVLVLFSVGTALETLALDRSRRSVEHLMELAPPQAHLLQGGIARTVPVEQVNERDLIVVRPGERVPLDGLVQAGRSSVDESPLTGESVPVDKEPGDHVLAGTLNAHGSLTVVVTAAAGNTTIARVATLVAEAQGSKAPSERFVDRFARLYTPLVFASAFLVAVAPTLAGGDSHTWLYRGLALLIVACPCALVISVPVSVVSAIGGAARKGVLIKGGQPLEDLARIKAVAVDKTGTLTQGRPDLVSIITTGDITEEQALFLMATLEHASEHPLAAAIVREAEIRDLPLGLVDDFQALPGRGVTGTIGTRTLWAGGPRMARDFGALLPDALTVIEHRGETAILLGEGDHLHAAFGLADKLRPQATAAVAALMARGIEPIMLTGDNASVARAVAEQVGITNWQSGLLPEDKLNAVRETIQQIGPTAMVGDGINDAPALAGASVGVAMGAAGSDIALSSADVALMGDELIRLPQVIDHSQRARAVMRQNIAVALGTKAIFVALAPLGLVSLVDAIAADMGVSLLVTLNGLRLLGRRPAAATSPVGSEAAAASSLQLPSSVQTTACTDGCCAPPDRDSSA